MWIMAMMLWRLILAGTTIRQVYLAANQEIWEDVRWSLIIISTHHGGVRGYGGVRRRVWQCTWRVRWSLWSWGVQKSVEDLLSSPSTTQRYMDNTALTMQFTEGSKKEATSVLNELVNNIQYILNHSPHEFQLAKANAIHLIIILSGSKFDILWFFSFSEA